MGDARRSAAARGRSACRPCAWNFGTASSSSISTRQAAPLGASLAKLEPIWEGYEAADLIAMPPVTGDTPLPWNWKVQVENFTDAYHPEFVHRGTHDFAPSVHPGGGVAFTAMQDGDNAIVRTVPMIKPDGGMMQDGWGAEAAFPAIDTLPDAQRKRLTFVMVPPSMTLVFAPGAVAYTLLSPGRRRGDPGVERPRDRRRLAAATHHHRTSGFRASARRRCCEGAAKIWAQDVPVNRGDAGRQAVPLRAARVLYGARNDTGTVQYMAAAGVSRRGTEHVTNPGRLVTRQSAKGARPTVPASGQATHSQIFSQSNPSRRHSIKPGSKPPRTVDRLPAVARRGSACTAWRTRSGYPAGAQDPAICWPPVPVLE